MDPEDTKRDGCASCELTDARVSSGFLTVPRLLGILLLATLVVAYFLSRANKYNGEPLSHWVLEAGRLSSSAGSVLRAAPREEVLALLREWVTATDSPMKLRVMGTLSKQRLVPIPWTTAIQKQHAALEAIIALGPDASPLAPEVVRVLTNVAYGRTAGFALCSMGTNGFALVEHDQPQDTPSMTLTRRAARRLFYTTEFKDATMRWAEQTPSQIREFRNQFERLKFRLPRPDLWRRPVPSPEPGDPRRKYFDRVPLRDNLAGAGCRFNGYDPVRSQVDPPAM